MGTAERQGDRHTMTYWADTSILRAGLLAAMCCGCLVPGQGRTPAAPQHQHKAQTVVTAPGHSFAHPLPREPIVPVEYPARPGRHHIEGEVKLWLTIDPTGTVIAVNPATESPDQDFHEAAKRAAWAQRWIPAKHDGKPVFTIVQYTYRFRRDSRDQAIQYCTELDAEERRGCHKAVAAEPLPRMKGTVAEGDGALCGRCWSA